ncbi:hypothetical protein SAMN05421835_11489 [Amycolatopsis sacchari]|uniref:Uncharacterized protein n=1 Tax=Amycolatopsis sacchari TaxID=115433 RepID=A0A1I3X0F5_9PSEU|nr:hypothetical protein [Amycolatopsis sacchari]SFK13262.1 hypothetical protein SAMN05421835_11489 [Amycolatopsis sacchari]
MQPFLNCAADTVARVGALELDALRVLLPVHCLDPASRPEIRRSPSLVTAAWFDDGDRAARTPAGVTLDGGRSPIADHLISLDHAKWSPDAFAGLLADLAARRGSTTPLLLTVRRN